MASNSNARHETKSREQTFILIRFHPQPFFFSVVSQFLFLRFSNRSNSSRVRLHVGAGGCRDITEQWTSGTTVMQVRCWIPSLSREERGEARAFVEIQLGGVEGTESSLPSAAFRYRGMCMSDKVGRGDGRMSRSVGRTN